MCDPGTVEQKGTEVMETLIVEEVPTFNRPRRVAVQRAREWLKTVVSQMKNMWHLMYTCVIIVMTYKRLWDLTRCYDIELIGTERIPECCGSNPNYTLHIPMQLHCAHCLECDHPNSCIGKTRSARILQWNKQPSGMTIITEAEPRWLLHHSFRLFIPLKNP